MFLLLSYKVERAHQFKRQYELCQTKCSLLQQHPVKVLFSSIIVSSFICSIFVATHSTSNKNYPNYPLSALSAVCVWVCVLCLSMCVRLRNSTLICQYQYLNSPAR